ncbi:MAG: hypothetical protein F4150_01330 [Chloroflexi bacterium]|nr:hypothetical protein [Chloroflexota bacterium]
MPAHDAADARRHGGPPTVPVAVTRDGELASGWAEALRAVGIEAEVEIGDAQTLVPGATLAVAGGPVDAMFGYVVRVPAAERRRAVRTLEQRGGPGGDGMSGAQPERGVLLRGALVALAAAAVVVAAALARLAGLP